MSMDSGKKTAFKAPISAVKKLVKSCGRYVLRKISDRHIRELSKKKCTTPKIKVAFLVQMPELWINMESVYERMSSDERIETCLVIVPAYDYANSREGTVYGDELQYFSRIAGNKKYIIAYEDSKWKDISRMGFDYLFYQRPYENYLPKKYRTQNLGKYVKVCYIPYATTELKKTVTYPEDFFRNIYFAFMDNDSVAEENNEKFPHRGHTSFLSIGYPLFETCLKIDSKCGYSMALWTPRWSYDSHIGGSHFFEYNEYMAGWKWDSKNLRIRVHPLLWDNFIKEKRLTEEEAERIRSRWLMNGIVIDKNKSILETYETTDILISDRSSVIPMFFLTGKPVIYCPTETDYSWLYLKILPGLYLANNQEELDSILQSLLNGIDPLKETRREIIDANFAFNAKATDNIVNRIAEDAR